MTWGDWIGLLSVLGVWSGFIVTAITTIVVSLHNKRHQSQVERDTEVNRRFEMLTTTIVGNQQRAELDHRALGAQVADIAATVARHYMPRADVEGALRRIEEHIGGLRGEIGGLRGETGRGLTALHGRVDRLFDRRPNSEPE